MRWGHKSGWGPKPGEQSVGAFAVRVWRRVPVKPERQLELVQKKLDKGLKKGRPDSPVVANLTRMAAELLHGLKRFADEIPLREEYLAACRRNMGTDDLATAVAETKLADCLFKLDRFEEADELLAHVIDVRTKIGGGDDPEVLAAMNFQSNVARKLGRLDEARKVQETILTWLDAHGYAESTDTVTAVRNLAASLTEMHDFERASELYRRVFETRSHLLGPDHPDTLNALVLLSSTLLAAGHKVEATVLARDWSERRKGMNVPDTPETDMARKLMALVEEKGQS
jgi:tetratricopeptide (TPR) repeat protein